MNSRRNFLMKGSLAGIGAFTMPAVFMKAKASGITNTGLMPTPTHAQDEAYWSEIQQAYTVNPDLINLNNGGVSPAPKVVQEALRRYNDQANEGPSYYMWRIMDKGREPLRQRLANLAGCEAGEIAINRNATEALNTVIYGLPLQKGDEVIGTKQDYPNMIQAWQQREMREGIKYKQLSFDFPVEDDDAIVAAFANAVSASTKLIHITHVINWVGQIMPVRKIADMAHAKGIEVLVDGAHSFGLLDFKIPDLHADYFGTSLHKFLSAPIGSGMLWIKQEKIEKIWPLFCNSVPQSNDIRKFETIGTRSFCIEQAIRAAIDFHESIGTRLKQERIHYLKHYWASKALEIPKVKLHTSLNPAFSCAIAGVSIEGVAPAELDKALLTDYKIHTVAIVWENISCVRVTPHVYTKLSDLDKLVDALSAIAKHKIA